MSESKENSSKLGGAMAALLPYAALLLILAVMGGRDAWRTSNGLKAIFFTLDNFISLAKECVPVIVAAVGMTLVVVSAGIDLSVGSTMGLAGAVAGLAANHFSNPWLGLLLGVAAGCACGIYNGLLIVALDLPPFIGTLSTLMAFRGGCELLTNNGSIFIGDGMKSSDGSALRKSFQWLSNGEVPNLNVSPSFIVAALTVAFLWVLLNMTRFGRRVYAVGSNAEAARLSGVGVPAVRMWTYALCGLLAGLAGVLVAARLGGPAANSGLGQELVVISAVVIGGASLSGGQGNVSGCVIGAALMAVLSNACTSLNVPDSWQKIIIGHFLAGAVAVDRMRRR